jgi:hypothetical protein
MNIYSRFIFEIKSHSHILSKSAFAILTRDDLHTRVIDVKEDRFTIETIMTDEMKKENKDYWGYALVVSSSYLMALNIAALGHFTWITGNNMFWHCIHVGPSGEMDQIVMRTHNKLFPDHIEKAVLTERVVKNSMIIYGSILREEEQSYRREYLKGILHIDAGFADLTFYREAFANFYRSFEHFMTNRILKKNKLRNELREIQDGLLSLGMSKDFCDEFQVLYKMRSEQVMHAQRLPKEIDGEDVLKIKAFTDCVLYKYYRSKADEWREEMQGRRS